jgi:hypothetical protein
MSFLPADQIRRRVGQLAIKLPEIRKNEILDQSETLCVV